MIDVAVAYGFGNENRYNLDTIPPNIQLSLYKYDLYLKYRDELTQNIIDSKTKVKVMHLPIDALRRDFDATYQMIADGIVDFGCKYYVIHPNKNIGDFVNNFMSAKLNAILCIENFQWRSKKEYRSPLYIIERCIQEQSPQLRMTLDTSHSEEVWFDHRIMPYILKHTSVIHLSNRAKGIGDHMPFNDSRGSLNLMAFINDLKRIHLWSGTIVLEYMEQYKDKIMKNYEFLQRLVA